MDAKKDKDKDENQLKQMLSMLHDLKDGNAQLQTDNLEMKKAMRELQKENAAMKVILEEVHGITVPRYISLPIKKFDERKKARLVIDTQTYFKPQIIVFIF